MKSVVLFSLFEGKIPARGREITGKAKRGFYLALPGVIHKLHMGSGDTRQVKAGF